MSSVEALLVAHWGLIVLSLYFLSDIAVAVTPRRYHEEKWYGLILKLFRWTSAHVHYDELGTTLKVPLLNIPLRFGAKPVSDTTDPNQKVPPPSSTT